MQLLFVCTGNICRSPLAERLAFAKAKAKGSGGTAYRVSSAGTRAVIGHPMHRHAAKVLHDWGGDSTDFTARQLTIKTASMADLVLVMTRAHRDHVLELAPKMLRRTFTLAEANCLVSEFRPRSLDELALFRPRLAGEDLPDIPDPIGHDIDVFADVASQIATLLPPVLEFCERVTEALVQERGASPSTAL